VPTHRCLVVGDVVSSRAVENRASLGGVPADGVERTNDVLRADPTTAVVAPFATPQGVDEVGGVLETLAGSYRAVRTLVEAVHPAEIRFAVVWGEVDVGVDAPDVARQDGPAFHRADDLLAELASEDRYVGLDVEFATGGGPGDGRGTERGLGPYVTTIGNQMDLLCAWKVGWTERQVEVVRRYREADTMSAVAEGLDVTVQTVSKTLGRARGDRILAIERDLEEAVAHLANQVGE
jgi:hypothetical protein